MSVSPPDAAYAIGLEPEQAVAHLRSKGAQVTGGWRQWLDGQHARAFTVANVSKLEVLQDIQRSLERALQEGRTFSQWKEDLVPELRKKGWWRREGTTEQLRAAGRIDEATGEIRKGLTPHRLRTIFATNMQSAYMAGRYQQMIEQVDDRPFWQYVAVLDGRTRPAHRGLNGKVFRYDDPAWGGLYPPNGFNCRCRVRALAQRDLQRAGLTVESSEGRLRQVKVPLKGGGQAESLRYVDRSLPGGGFQPDPGFSSNPGRDTWQPRLEGMDVGLSRQYVEAAVQGPAFTRFIERQDRGVFPVGVLRPEDQRRLGTQSTVAYLSSQTLDKQEESRRGQTITLDDYRRIPEILDKGDAYAQAAGNRLLFFWEGDQVLRLALKVTADRRQLFVTSLLRTSRRRAEEEIRAARLRAAGTE